MKKAIPGGIIAAGTFDDILCIILFGIFASLSYFGTGGVGHKDESMGHKVGMIIAEIVAGFGAGFITGFFGWLFRFTKTWKSNHFLKAFYIVSVAILLTVASELSGYKSSKYIAALTCGYIC